MSKYEDKSTDHGKKQPQINEERIEKSLSTSCLDDKLSSAGNPRQGSGGTGYKDKSSG
ncbi:hypothetical protein ACCT14_32035 [Rhizobium brockwellii]|uniref:hypothetical protein n=1 Tax=Rhizobium brockwellii TaxID=3019932 RepID=UPI003F9E74D7